MLASTVSIDVLVTSLGLTWRPHDGRNSAWCQVSDEPGIALLKFLAIASYCGWAGSLASPGLSWCSSLAWPLSLLPSGLVSGLSLAGGVAEILPLSPNRCFSVVWLFE